MILKGKPVTPSFRTSPEEWSREEWAKLRTKGFTSVPEEIKEDSSYGNLREVIPRTRY